MLQSIGVFIFGKDVLSKIQVKGIGEKTAERLKLLLKKDILYLTTDEILYEEETTSIAFDHSLILAYAINTLKDKVKNTDIVFNLMPSEFTIGELKQVYEIILGKKLINSAFRRVISKKIEEIDEERPLLTKQEIEEVEIQIKYEGYINKSN